MTELEEEKMRNESAKFEFEARKLMVESQKLFSENLLIEKKNRWYEFSLLFAAFGVGVAFAKLFM